MEEAHIIHSLVQGDTPFYYHLLSRTYLNVFAVKDNVTNNPSWRLKMLKIIEGSEIKWKFSVLRMADNIKVNLVYWKGIVAYGHKL